MPRYTDVRVSESLLARLKKEQDDAEGMARYGRFKAWLHYANLKRWQDQGWHFHYLTNGSDLTAFCTCGLEVGNDEEPDVVGHERLNLDRVQRAYGHRNLPSLKGQAIAIIIDFQWLDGKGAYWFHAFCQGCGAGTGLRSPETAKKFCDAHNQSCKKDTQN